MDAFALLAELRAAGVSLAAGQGSIKAGPRAAVTPAIVEAIRAHKPALLEALGDEAAVLRWLESIRETDAEIIADVLDRIRRNPDARAFYVALGRGLPLADPLPRPVTDD